jgi:hypothetical protein
MTMIVPFAAGGPQDVLGRLLAQRMSEILRQSIVIENIGGAAGVTGSRRVADARPDGYTMGIGSVGTHAHNQSLYKRPPYDPVADFTPVALTNSSRPIARAASCTSAVCILRPISCPTVFGGFDNRMPLSSPDQKWSMMADNKEREPILTALKAHFGWICGPRSAARADVRPNRRRGR